MQKRRWFLLRGAWGRGRRRRSKFRGVENLGCWPMAISGPIFGKKFLSSNVKKKHYTNS
jgi:hypothetical protein